MKRQLLIAASCLFIFVSSTMARTWTLHTTGREIDAEFVELSGEMVSLRTSYGGVIEVKFSDLTHSDRDYVRRAVTSSPDLSDSPEDIKTSGFTPASSPLELDLSEVHGRIEESIDKYVATIKGKAPSMIVVQRLADREIKRAKEAGAIPQDAIVPFRFDSSSANHPATNGQVTVIAAAGGRGCGYGFASAQASGGSQITAAAAARGGGGYGFGFAYVQVGGSNVSNNRPQPQQ